MNKKIIIPIIILVIGVSATIGYFFLNKNKIKTTPSNTGSQAENFGVSLQEKNTPTIQRTAISTQKKTETATATEEKNEVIEIYRWADFVKKYPFTFDTPAGWEATKLIGDAILAGYVNQIQTVKSSERLALGYEIQSPEDETRIVTIHDARIYFYFENLLSSKHLTRSGLEKNSSGDLVCFTGEEYYDTGLPTYGTILGEKIKICPIENVEDSSYGVSLVTYIPITENQGLVIDGSTSREGNMTIKEFLPIYKQVLSTFKWIK